MIDTANPQFRAGDTSQSGPMSPRRHLCLYLAVAVPICFLLVWRTDVVSMEGIIALGGRHMLATGDWLVPSLYGEMYAFKPALAYWMAAGTEALFGRQTEFTLRLPTAVCGFGLGLAVLVAMGRLVSPGCGLYSALAAVTSALFIEQVDTAGFEMPLALGVTLAMLAACRNLVRDAPDWRIWILGYAGLLLAFLSKGLPAVVVFAPGLLVGASVLRRLPRLLGAGHLAGVMLFLAGAGLYAWLAYRAEGTAAFHQHFSEIALRSGQWTPGRLLLTVVKPVTIFGVLLPWSAVLAVWAIKAVRPTLTEEQVRISRVAWAFLLTGTLAFLTVSTDSTRYYLPLVTPMAMLSGLGVARLPDRWGVHVARSLTVIGLIIWVVQAGFVQPHRAETRSLRSVAAAFALQVPASTVVFVDTQDSYSSLFYYLGRPVASWRSAGDTPAAGSFVMLVDGRQPLLGSRSKLRLESVAEVVARDGHRYVLSRLVPGAP
ncbi:MAG: glycosyltransferase family 39 protein [Planctomycetota bacterium]